MSQIVDQNVLKSLGKARELSNGDYIVIESEQASKSLKYQLGAIMVNRLQKLERPPIIAGSFVASAWTGGTFTDIDLFFRNDKRLDAIDAVAAELRNSNYISHSATMNGVTYKNKISGRLFQIITRSDLSG